MANSIDKSRHQSKLNNVTVNDNESVSTICEYKLAYNTYKALPKIILIASIILSFIIAIICGSQAKKVEAFFIAFIPSIIASAIVYFIMKVTCATRILTLEYTRRILYTLQIDSLQEKIKQIDNKEVKS